MSGVAPSVVDRVALDVHNAMLREPSYARRRIGLGHLFEFEGAYWSVAMIDRGPGGNRIKVSNDTHGEREMPMSDFLAHQTTRCVGIDHETHKAIRAAVNPLRGPT